MSVSLSFALYIISFLPLWISVVFIDVMSILDGGSYLWTEWISIAVILVTLLASNIVLFTSLIPKSHENMICYEIREAREQKMVTAEFLLSYILPLTAFEFTEWTGVVLFLIFFCTFWYLTARHNVFSANIMLEIKGFRFYECRLMSLGGTEAGMTVISRRYLTGMPGERIYIKSLNNELKIDVDQE